VGTGSSSFKSQVCSIIESNSPKQLERLCVSISLKITNFEHFLLAMSSMSTLHIHLAFEDIPEAIFRGLKKSMKGMGLCAQVALKFFVGRGVHHA